MWWSRTGRVSGHAVVSVAAGGAPAHELRHRDLAIGIDDVDALLALLAAERAAMDTFLGSLTGGSLAVLYTARGSASWRAPSTFGTDVRILGPLDPVAFAALAGTVTAPLPQPPLVSLTVERAMAGIPCRGSRSRPHP
ncbi:MAG: hypothetical protein ACRDS0_31080 [Pseudonocardiaceae bacterium]